MKLNWPKARKFSREKFASVRHRHLHGWLWLPTFQNLRQSTRIFRLTWPLSLQILDLKDGRQHAARLTPAWPRCIAARPLVAASSGYGSNSIGAGGWKLAGNVVQTKSGHLKTCFGPSLTLAECLIAATQRPQSGHSSMVRYIELTDGRCADIFCFAQIKLLIWLLFAVNKAVEATICNCDRWFFDL